MDIISIEMAKMRSMSEVSKAPHVFEIRLQNITYFVGEDPTFGGRDGDFLVSPESGTGLEQARYWEHAIRQALMPVTPTSSITSEGNFLYLYLNHNFQMLSLWLYVDMKVATITENINNPLMGFFCNVCKLYTP